MSSNEELEELKDEARKRFEEDPSLDPKTVSKDLGLKLGVCRALKGRVTRKQKVAATTQQEIPTVEDFLKQLLTDIGFKRISAVVKLVDKYGYNVPGIFAAMKDVGASNTHIRYTIKSWSAYEGETIPNWIMKFIGGGSPTGPTGYPGYQGSYGDGYGDPNTARELRDKAVEIAKLQEKLTYEQEKRSSAEQDYKIVSQALQEEREKRMKAEHQRDLENVKSELREEINQKVGSMSSDLGVLASVVKEGSGVGKRLERILTAPMVQPIPQQQKQPNPAAREGVLGQLKEKGLVTVIKERVVTK